MKEYYGNYLGLCVSGGDKDPEQRGRCQIFVPHIMPSLFEGWNETQKDKKINILGTGLDNSLDPTIVNTLKEILPWAECATPIIGASPSGYVNSQGQLSEVNKNTAGAVAPGASGTLVKAGASYLSPDATNALSNALASVQVNESKSGYCARDTTDILRSVGLFPGSVGSPSGANADQMGSIYKQNGWTEVIISQPDQAPANSVVLAKDSSSGFFHSNIRLADGWTKTGIGGEQTGTQGAFWGRGALTEGSYCAAYIPPKGVVDNFLTSKGISSDYKLSNVVATDSTPPTENPSSVKIGGNESPHQPANVLQGGGLVITPQINTGRTIVSASGTNNSGATNVTYSDGTTETLSGPRPLRNNNPGNLEYGDFAKSHGAVGSDGRYAVFPDVQTGTNAQISLLKSSSYNTLTVSQMVNKYAPPSENPGYLPKLVNLTGLSPDTKLNSLTDEQFANMVDKMQVVEGFKTNDGNIKPYMPYATAQGPNTNNQAGGMFGYAHEGALVWVFFQGGNPLFPVYFAASYGQKEWNNIYQVNSPGKPGKGASINLHGGGINSTAVMPDDGGAEPGFSVQLYGTNGSALTLAHDQSQFYTPYIHREHIGGDRHEVIMANKESHIQGTHNVKIHQDQFISIGDFSDDAKLAHSEIQEILEKIPDFYK